MRDLLEKYILLYFRAFENKENINFKSFEEKNIKKVINNV